MKLLTDDRNAPSCGSGLSRSIVVLPVKSLQCTTHLPTVMKKAAKKGKVQSRFALFVIMVLADFQLIMSPRSSCVGSVPRFSSSPLSVSR